MNPLSDGVAAGIVTSYQGDPLDWLAEHVRLPHSARSTRFQRDNAPWLNDIFRAVCDDRIKQIVARAPTGGGKTTLLELVVPWVVAQQPGPMMLVGQTDETTKEWAESRLMPILESCPPVARLFPHDRHQKRKTAIMFPHMALFMSGANMSSLQEKSMRYCYGDECWRWAPGLVDELKKRHHCRWNRKTILVSQGSKTGDDFDREFHSGVVHEWGTECESCGDWHKYLWTSIKYDEIRDEKNEWNWAGVMASVRHECPLCGHATLDTTQGRRGMASRGRYEVEHGAQPIAGNVSFTWSAQSVWWIAWADMVVEWLKANEEKRRGNTEPLKQFRQKRLAQSWSDEQESPEINLTAGDYHLADHGDGQPIDGEAKRLMAVDRQRDHFWAVCRAWRSDGSSRLIWCGKVLTEEQLRQIQQRLKVHDKLVFMDAQYDTGLTYACCARWNWTALHGSGRKSFQHSVGNKMVDKLYSPVKDAAAPTGGRARYIFWANEGVKDRFAQLRAMGSPVWEYGLDTPKDYLKQIVAEAKREVVDKFTKTIQRRYVRIHRDNHMGDCEAMVTAVALMLGLLRETVVDAEEDGA